MTAGLLLALLFTAWGSQAVAPWRLRQGTAAEQRGWALAALPLAVGGMLLALLLLQANPDAALASSLAPFLSFLPGRIVALTLAALLLADGLLAVARTRLEAAGWAVVAGFGLAHLAAASYAAELLRTGQGPESPPVLLVGAAACRLVVGLAAGELLVPSGTAGEGGRRPIVAPAAGLALPLSLFLLPEALRQGLLGGGAWLTLAAAAALFLAARWLPTRLRLPALAAAILLAGLFWGQAAELSQELADRPLPVLEPLHLKVR